MWGRGLWASPMALAGQTEGAQFLSSSSWRVLPWGEGTVKPNGKLYLETPEYGHISVFSAEMGICIIYDSNDTVGVLYNLQSMSGELSQVVLIAVALERCYHLVVRCQA